MDSKSLMGLLAPVVMGVLGQQRRTSGLDATGLARLLTSQKDNIASAIPWASQSILAERTFSTASSLQAMGGGRVSYIGRFKTIKARLLCILDTEALGSFLYCNGAG